MLQKCPVFYAKNWTKPIISSVFDLYQNYSDNIMHKKLFESDTMKYHNSQNHRTNWCRNAFILLVYGLDNKKKVAEISLDDQILLFIVQREAIVDITGTL